MRKLMVTTMLSLDGVMQAPGGPEEDQSDGFAFGGWTAPFVDDEGMEAKAAEVSGPFDLLLGRRTYEIFAGVLAERPRRRPSASRSTTPRSTSCRGAVPRWTGARRS